MIFFFFFLCSPSQTNEDEHKKQSCVLTAVMGSCDKVNGDGFFGVSTEISFPVFMFVAPEAGSDVFFMKLKHSGKCSERRVRR